MKTKDKKKSVGRPKNKIHKEQYSVRIPPDLMSKIDEVSASEGKSRSDKISEILMLHVDSVVIEKQI